MLARDFEILYNLKLIFKTLLGVSKMDGLKQYIRILCYMIIILNSDIFLFTCRFIIISQLYKSREYNTWEFSIHLFFLFFFLSPKFIVHDISVFFHGMFHHASTIMSYVSIVVEIVTFNILEGT
jgi:hypothetical protein